VSEEPVRTLFSFFITIGIGSNRLHLGLRSTHHQEE
jgi:hypothetical protein